jgi:hypothetical protein
MSHRLRQIADQIFWTSMPSLGSTAAMSSGVSTVASPTTGTKPRGLSGDNLWLAFMISVLAAQY